MALIKTSVGHTFSGRRDSEGAKLLSSITLTCRIEVNKEMQATATYAIISLEGKMMLQSRLELLNRVEAIFIPLDWITDEFGISRLLHSIMLGDFRRFETVEDAIADTDEVMGMYNESMMGANIPALRRALDSENVKPYDPYDFSDVLLDDSI